MKPTKTALSEAFQGPDVAASSLGNASLLGDAEIQSEVLEDLATAVNYRRWLIDLVTPDLVSPCLEIGSGLGVYAEEIASRGFQVTATEGHPARVAALQKRFADDSRVTVEELLAPVTRTADYSSLVSFNVLEHIEDHVGALRAFGGLCRPGGSVLAIVPAFPIGMSRFDREIGHVRRYRKATLRAAAESAGLEVVRIRHINSIGLIAWIIMMRLGHGHPKKGAALTVYDRLVLPVLRWIEGIVEPPFGQSLVLHARTPASTDIPSK